MKKIKSAGVILLALATILFFILLWMCVPQINPSGEYWDDPSDIMPERESVKTI